MNAFWQLTAPARATAVIEAASGRAISYGQLAGDADQVADSLGRSAGKGLVFLFCRNDYATLAAYLGCVRAGQAIALLPAGGVRHAEAWLEAYRPEWVLAPAGLGPFTGYSATAVPAGLPAWRRLPVDPAGSLHADLALLLTTSGSTGSPKMVRLSSANLSANAAAIATYLGLTPAECAPTTLPLSYSYGLSVVHSHLAAGATLLLGEFPVVQRESWACLARHGATSFAGVPLLYQTLRRLRFDPRTQPALRTYTQAGGRLEGDTQRWFLDAAASARFFVMYGQTEATARISYVPPERLREKPDSIGRAIPGGELSLDPANGEILYRGPNVMLGYAQNRADLALGDTQHGQLRTGDLGAVDAEGFYAITGRLKRFLKIAGLRVGLDELERHLEVELDGPVACSGVDEALQVHTEATLPAARIHALLQEKFGLPPSLVGVHTGRPLARLATGKIDYAALIHA